MSDNRPTLENRLSSRLSRSFSPAGRLLERVARHAGNFSPVQRLTERQLGSIARRESFGGLIGQIASRLETRGEVRPASPSWGTWGTQTFVTQAPPWMAPAAEAPAAPIQRSGWFQSHQGANVVGWGRSPGSTTGALSRSATRPPGFASRSAVARSAASALATAAPPVRRSSARQVSALARAEAAGLGGGSAFSGARTAGPGNLGVARALGRASGQQLGAARSAVRRAAGTDLSVSAAGRAVARSDADRPSGRGFAVARRSLGMGAPDLALARAPIAPSATAEEAAGPTVVQGFAPREFVGSPVTGWVDFSGRSVSTTRVARSESSAITPARVARAAQRADAVQRAASRPLARATAAASAPTVEAPRSFAPLTSPARRAAARASSFSGAPTALAREAAFSGATTATPARSAHTPAPVARAIARRMGGATRPAQEAVRGVPRMAATLSASAMDLATAMPVSRSAEPAAPAPTPTVSGWATPSSAPAGTPRGPMAAGWAAPIGAQTGARVARQASRPMTGARVARSAGSETIGAPVASGSTGGFTGARLARSASSSFTGATVARQTSRPLTGARTARSADGSFVGARVARSGDSAFVGAPVASPDASGITGARVARSAGSETIGAPVAAPGASGITGARVARSTAGTFRGAAVARSTSGGFEGAPTASASSGSFVGARTAAGLSRSARVPTAVARAAASDFVGATVARSRGTNTIAQRADAALGTIARSFSRSEPAAPVARSRFAPSAPALTLPDAPVSRSASADAGAPDTAGSPPVVSGWATPTATTTTTSGWFSGARTAELSRSASAPPAARALARYAAPTSTATTATQRVSRFASARTAGAWSPADGSTASVARSAQGSGLSRLLARDAEIAPTSTGDRTVARSMTTAATLGVPSVRRSRLPSIDGTVAAAPTAAVARQEAAPTFTPQATTRTVDGFARSEAPSAPTAARSAAGPTSTAPTARALARAGISGAPTATASEPVRRAAARNAASVRRSEGSSRPLTRAAASTLPMAPTSAPTASRSAEPGAPFAGARVQRTAQGWFEGAAVARAADGSFVGARTADAPSSVSRALARSSDSSTGTAAGTGFRSPRGLQRRAGAPASPGMPVASLPALARSEASAGPASVGFDPSLSPGFTGARVSGWGPSPSGASASTVRTQPLSRRAERRADGRTAAPLARAASELPSRAATTGRSPAPTSSAPVARSAWGSDQTGAPTAQPGSGWFVGAALARAVNRSSVEDDTSPRAGQVRRSTALPAAVASGWAKPSEARRSAVRRRADVRSGPMSTTAVARSAGGGGFKGALLARQAAIFSDSGTTTAEAGTLASGEGMVRRAASQMLARHEEKAQRRARAGQPLHTAMAGAPVARSGTSAGGTSTGDLARMIKREVAEMTHITAGAPTVSRSAQKALKRSSSAQEAQGRGADRDVGKKPDLDDFLRRAVRRVMIEEQVVADRELSFMD